MPPVVGLELLERDGVAFFRVPGWAEKGALAVFSTRRGGVSRGSYATLNLSFNTGDEAGAVLANRRRLARALGVRLERWVAGQQVHGRRVALVGEADAGRGATALDGALPATDALITRTPGLVLTAYFADCVPVLFFSPRAPAVGVAHAGWRGTVAGIAAATAEAMVRELGVDPADLLVAVGPYIGPCCYSVGEEVVAGLEGLLGREAEQVVTRQGNRWQVDLGRANFLALRRFGLAAEQVALFSCCTSCHQEWFFSHRGSGGGAGRFAALIALQ